MKFTVLLLLCLSSLISSNSFTLAEANKAISCIFEDQSRVDLILDIFNFLFAGKSEVIFKIEQYKQLAHDCLGIEFKSLKNFRDEKSEILEKIKNYDAPLVLRVHLYEYFNDYGKSETLERCKLVTSYDEYKAYTEICKLFE